MIIKASQLHDALQRLKWDVEQFATELDYQVIDELGDGKYAKLSCTDIVLHLCQTKAYGKSRQWTEFMRRSVFNYLSNRYGWSHDWDDAVQSITNTLGYDPREY